MLHFWLSVERVADDGPDEHDRAENNHILDTWFHQRINDVGSDQKFQPEQQVVAQEMPEPLAVLFHSLAAHRQEFRPDKTDQAAGDAEDDNRYAQHTDPETRMMKICHRPKRL